MQYSTMNLTPHFTLEEMIFSQTAARNGLDNTPTPEIIDNLRKTCETLEEIRTLLGGVPIFINSGYRSPAVNAAVGGSTSSAHMQGLAADFTAPAFGTVFEVATAIAGSDIAYDQLIHEYGSWVHIALSAGVLRQQDLSIFSGTGYLQGIVGQPVDTHLS